MPTKLYDTVTTYDTLGTTSITMVAARLHVLDLAAIDEPVTLDFLPGTVVGQAIGVTIKTTGAEGDIVSKGTGDVQFDFTLQVKEDSAIWIWSGSVWELNSKSLPPIRTVGTATSPVAAASGDLIMFDLASSGADAIVNVPASGQSAFFGACINGLADGHKLEIKDGSTVLYTLDSDSEVLWLAWDGAAWKISSQYVSPPVFEPRFSPLGAWLSAGADANLVDVSGNSRDLTKGVTIDPGMGYGLERLATGYPGRYARADTTFALAGAMSYEFFATYMLQALGGYCFGWGVGSGGQTLNLLWALRIDIVSGVPRWRHRQQSGVNITSEFYGPVVAFGPSHVCVVREAPSAGTTLTKMYVNGAFVSQASLTTPDGGGSSSLYWGGTAGNQAPLLSQWGAVWSGALSPERVRYLARSRLSKRGPLGV